MCALRFCRGSQGGEKEGEEGGNSDQTTIETKYVHSSLLVWFPLKCVRTFRCSKRLHLGCKRAGGRPWQRSPRAQELRSLCFQSLSHWVGRELRRQKCVN